MLKKEAMNEIIVALKELEKLCHQHGFAHVIAIMGKDEDGSSYHTALSTEINRETHPAPEFMSLAANVLDASINNKIRTVEIDIAGAAGDFTSILKEALNDTCPCPACVARRAAGRGPSGMTH